MDQIIAGPAGVGYYRPAPVAATAEAVTGGGGLYYSGVLSTVQALGRHGDEAHRRYGDRVYDYMLRDPVVGGSIDVLKLAVLANDLDVVPRVRARPGRPGDNRAEVDESTRVADLVRDALDGMARPIRPALWEMLDAVAYGSYLGELVWEVPEAGKMAGRLALKALKPKSRRSWSFVVDPYYNVLGYLAATAAGEGFAVLPPEKFALLTWGGRGCDPRGLSILDRAAEAWNFRAQLPADHFKFLKRFATPIPIARVANSGDANPAVDPITGALTGGTATRADEMQAVLAGLQAGRYAVIDAADAIDLMEPRADGAAFAAADEAKRREIVLAILLQARATMEAQHGSRADSQTGQDVLGNFVKHLRKLACRMVEWEVYYKVVLYNEGPDVAAKYTPTASLGEWEHQDTADLLKSAAAAGYAFAEEQLPELDQEFGMPVRQMGSPLAVRPAVAPPGQQPGQGQQQGDQQQQGAA